MITVVQLPNGATQERTLGVLKQIEDYYLTKESKVVDQMITVAGFSFFGRGQNGGIAFVRLKDWKERTGPARPRRRWSAVPSARCRASGRHHLPAQPAGDL